ncbi:MAG: tRNA-dihydrouridine synthase, partial [Candidatus Hydrogenedentes bacterium]|nr:tRNA-dihydrouridine synthase [Candidatus Hydrogenedentota bacterium]
GWLERLKNTVSMPILGNGDITTPEGVKRMFETGCDGVMIGRGAIQNPWIFGQAKHYLATGDIPPSASVPERIAMCIKHLQRAIAVKGERKGTIEFRKHYSGYLRGLPHVAKLRAELMKLSELEPIIERLHRFQDEFSAPFTAA